MKGKNLFFISRNLINYLFDKRFRFDYYSILPKIWSANIGLYLKGITKSRKKNHFFSKKMAIWSV